MHDATERGSQDGRTENTHQSPHSEEQSSGRTSLAFIKEVGDPERSQESKKKHAAKGDEEDAQREPQATKLVPCSHLEATIATIAAKRWSAQESSHGHGERRAPEDDNIVGLIARTATDVVILGCKGDGESPKHESEDRDGNKEHHCHDLHEDPISRREAQQHH